MHRYTDFEQSRPLILVGHSLGGILVKAAFVKASQTEAYAALRDTISGLIFIGTPHLGIRNQDWAEIWDDEPSGILIRDLSPGSSFLKVLGESFKQYLSQEKILTVYELQESHTILKKEDGTIDRKGKLILRIEEEAACVHVDNETRVPIDEDHSKIAKLRNVEGNPYHQVKDKLNDILSHANALVFLHGLTDQQVIFEYRSYKTTGSDHQVQEQKKAASQELATILRDASFSAQNPDPVRRRLAPTMSIFDFEGYIDDTESERLIFLYCMPAQLGVSSDEMINRSMNLAFWTRDIGFGAPLMEERFAVAYHLCHTVFNQHISGWVHKRLRPENVILVPVPNKGSKLIQGGKIYTHIPYLKGFELSRKIELASDRLPELDTESDVYRHPNRRGKDVLVQFRPVHDLYALGVLLVEIGTSKPIMASIKALSPRAASGTLEGDTIQVAKEKLPKNLGTNYAECVLRCLQ
ncbi:unnamed protein product [Alternaria alternata]